MLQLGRSENAFWREKPCFPKRKPTNKCDPLNAMILDYQHSVNEDPPPESSCGSQTRPQLTGRCLLDKRAASGVSAATRGTAESRAMTNLTSPSVNETEKLESYRKDPQKSFGAE